MPLYPNQTQHYPYPRQLLCPQSIQLQSIKSTTNQTCNSQKFQSPNPSFTVPIQAVPNPNHHHSIANNQPKPIQHHQPVPALSCCKEKKLMRKGSTRTEIHHGLEEEMRERRMNKKKKKWGREAREKKLEMEENWRDEEEPSHRSIHPDADADAASPMFNPCNSAIKPRREEPSSSLPLLPPRTRSRRRHKFYRMCPRST